MNKIIPAALLLIAGAMTSCNDSLNLTPPAQISQADYFKNETDLQLFSNPFYNNLLNKEPYDEQSDLLVQHNLSAIMQGGTKRTVPNSGGGWSWSNLRRMNTLLAYANQCSDEKAVVKYTALTRFFRAFFYFEKVRRFGDVPWYDKELGSADPDLYKARESRELIMSHMLEDIDYAIANLPDKKSETSSPYRANKYAAMALKAQFCLFEGTYRKYHNISLEGHDSKFYLEQAADAADQLIKSGQYKLYSTGKPDQDYLNLFAAEDANKDEYILAIKFDYGLGIYHNATAFTLVATQGRPGLTRKMVNMYLMKDGTAFTDKIGWQEMQYPAELENRDPRLAQTIRTPGYHRIGQTDSLVVEFDVTSTGYQLIKFVQDPTASGGQVDRNSRSTCDLPVYRYAEVLLNYAEAKAELGTLTQDDLDRSVNVIRKRAGMPNLNMAAANANPDRYLSDPETGFTNVEGANKGVILEIRRERAIELIEEGYRINDLFRWKAGYCLDQSILGMYFPGAGEYDLDNDGKTDLILYAKGTSKPNVKDVQVYELGSEIVLSEDNHGYIDHHRGIGRTKFNEARDYLYPIPINERSLNHNLTQNPGWDDGLSF